jgi:hypothetical protein
MVHQRVAGRLVDKDHRGQVQRRLETVLLVEEASPFRAWLELRAPVGLQLGKRWQLLVASLPLYTERQLEEAKGLDPQPRRPLSSST